MAAVTYQEFKPVQKELKSSPRRLSGLEREQWEAFRAAGLIYMDYPAYGWPEMVGLTNFGYRVHDQKSTEEAIVMHRAQVDKQLQWLRDEDFRLTLRTRVMAQNPYGAIMTYHNNNSEYSHEWDMELAELND